MNESVTAGYRMPYRALRICSFAFTATVLITVVLNYSIALICRGECYERKVPVEFPSHLFISSALRAPPTHYTGIAGFSLAAGLGFVMSVARCTQTASLVEKLEDGRLRSRLRRTNWVSMIFVPVFPIALVLLSVFVPSIDIDASFSTSMHYASTSVCLIAMLFFMAIQIHHIEGPLIESARERLLGMDVETPLIPDSSCVTKLERLERSFKWKETVLTSLIVSLVLLIIGFSFWGVIPELTIWFKIVAVFCETVELYCVCVGSCLLGLTDFAYFKKSLLW